MTTLKNFKSAFQIIQSDIHETAKSKGWWDSERNDGELIALMHSELSEALEALRNGNINTVEKLFNNNFHRSEYQLYHYRDREKREIDFIIDQLNPVARTPTEKPATKSIIEKIPYSSG